MEPSQRNLAQLLSHIDLRAKTFYQCDICKVIFERSDQCVAHVKDKHNGSLLASNPAISNDLDQSVADVVKLDGLKRAATVKNIQCHFCHKVLKNVYNEGVVIIGLDRELNSGHCCKKCLKSQ